MRHYRDFETDIEVTELAAQLKILVHANKQELANRAISGPFIRYGGSIEAGKAAIRRGQEQDDPDHLVPLNRAGNVIGAASLYRQLDLKWVPLPLPPNVVPDRIKSRNLRQGAPNITAWVDARSLYLLGPIYSELADRARAESHEDETVHSWTLEPTGSTEFIHKAIKSAGLSRLGSSRRYDDGESFTNRWNIPSNAPARTLYIDENIA